MFLLTNYLQNRRRFTCKTVIFLLQLPMIFAYNMTLTSENDNSLRGKTKLACRK